MTFLVKFGGNALFQPATSIGATSVDETIANHKDVISDFRIRFEFWCHVDQNL